MIYIVECLIFNFQNKKLPYENSCLNNGIFYPGSTTEDDDCIRMIGGGDYCSDVSKCRVSVRGASREGFADTFNVGFFLVCIP